LGIFSNSLSQVILPAMSTQALDEDPQSLKRTLSWGLRATFLVMLPASVGFMALSSPIISTLFGGGKFDQHSAQVTAAALFFYSIGLFAYGAKKILQSCFFALRDTVTPTKVAFLALILNIIFNAVLMFPMKIAGLALATSLSGIITFIVLFVKLRRKLGDLDVKEIAVSFLRILAASACMGAVCLLISRETAFLNKYLNLSVALACGFISYIIFCLIFRVSEMQDLRRWLLK
jgi:putative peptidoglycan lipid II flippase